MNPPLKVWVAGARPRTLPAAVVPVVVGTAAGYLSSGRSVLHGLQPNGSCAAQCFITFSREVSWLNALLALLVALGIQIGTNYVNDYADGVRGTDEQRVGPVRLVAGRLASVRQVQIAAAVAFGVAGLAGLVLAARVTWWFLPLGLICVVAGWGYTGGRRPYGYLGLGEVFVFVFFGLVATVGTVYVETSRVTAMSVLVGCGMGFLATAILVLNNLRDIDTDAAAGKRTLATRIGRERTRILLLVLVCAAFAVPIVLFVSGLAPVTVMLVHFAIPIAAVPVRTAFATAEPPALVGALKRMAMAQLAYALLFTLGVLM